MSLTQYRISWREPERRPVDLNVTFAGADMSETEELDAATALAHGLIDGGYHNVRLNRVEESTEEMEIR